MAQNSVQPSALTIAIRAALKAGQDILSIYNDPAQDFGIERKADNSPLTLADKAAHRRIISHLSATGFPVLSEEGAQIPYEERKQWEGFWMVDPLDGTKEFIKKNGEFTVNIAFILNGRPHMGVIYVPVRRQLYFADPFIGAYRMDNVVSISNNVTLPELIKSSQQLPLASEPRDSYVVVASRSHLSQETIDFIEEKKKEHAVVETVSSGSSLKICLVAEGSADSYPRFAPTMEWDTAAGHAIASCAGRHIYEAGSTNNVRYNKEDLHNPWFLVE